MSDSPSKRSSSLPRCFSSDILSRGGGGCPPPSNTLPPSALSPLQRELSGSGTKCRSSYGAWNHHPSCRDDGRPGCADAPPPAPVSERSAARRPVHPFLISNTWLCFCPADWPRSICLTHFSMFCRKTWRLSVDWLDWDFFKKKKSKTLYWICCVQVSSHKMSWRVAWQNTCLG